MTRPRRLLTIGHSYVVALNRRLPHELALAGRGKWEVTVAAPSFVHGDLRPIELERSPDEACELVPVHAYMTGRPHVMHYGRTLRRLVAEPWDLVHCWEEPFVTSGFQVARWVRSSQLVYYTFQNLPKRYPPPFGWFERYGLRRSSGWIAAGRTVEQALESRRGYPEKPHCIIPLGVDVEVYRPNAQARAEVYRSLGWSAAGPPVVGYLGRFVPEKGLNLLMKALDAQQSPWRALFVGGGQVEAELRNWAAGFADDRARIVSGVKHDAVPAHLNAMDLLAAPSQTTPRWKEQFGRMLIEAMACGIPVVGSDSGEIPFVVGGAGEIVGETDLPAWTRTLANLLNNPSRRTELAVRGRKRVESLFSWPVVARQHLDFFEALLS